MIPLSEIRAARARITPPILTTPVTYDPDLQIWLKWESRQITGSFKDEPAFEEVVEFGRAIRAADRPAEDTRESA